MPFELPAAVIETLADPQTLEPVKLATDAQLVVLRDLIAKGRARRNGGGALPPSVEAAFISQKGKVVYPVVDGLADFRIEERIELEDAIE